MTASLYTLHYAPDNASLVIRLALEELGQPYDTMLVDRRAEGHKSERYLALNPNGLIPVLETPQGALFETAAILLWLSDRHGMLGPAPQDDDRDDFLKWLFFLSNTLHPALRRMFYADAYIGSVTEDQAQLRSVTIGRISAHLRVLEDRWQATPKPPIALELYLMPMLRWLALYPATEDRSWFRLMDYPALHEAATRLETRPSVAKAIHAEGLGPLPFTAPQHPTPPKGHAT